MISAKRIKYTVSLLVMAGLLQVTSVFKLVGEDGWVVVLVSVAVLVLIAWMYRHLMSLPGPDFTGGSVFIYCFGKRLGWTVTVLYMLYFLFSAVIDLRNISNVISGGMFPEMPVFVIPAMMSLVLIYAARKGAPAISALGFIIFTVIFVLQCLDLLLQFPQLDWQNYFPLFESRPVDFVHALFYCITVPMGKIALVLFLFPVQSPRELVPTSRTYIFGALLGGLLMLLIVLRDTGILGVLVRYLSNTIFEAVQLLDAFGFLSRIEIVFIFTFFLYTMFNLALCCSISSGIFCNLFRLKDPRNIWVITGAAALIFVCAAFICKTSEGLKVLMRQVQPFISVWFLILFPAAALLAGKRKASS